MLQDRKALVTQFLTRRVSQLQFVRLMISFFARAPRAAQVETQEPIGASGNRNPSFGGVSRRFLAKKPLSHSDFQTIPCANNRENISKIREF
jgi:hypothetical protein